jgi:hypothetical protein
MKTITIKQIRQLVREVALNESMAADEAEQKKKIVDSLVALYYRHELEPSEIAIELAAEAQKEIDEIKARTKR